MKGDNKKMTNHFELAPTRKMTEDDKAYMNEMVSKDHQKLRVKNLCKGIGTMDPLLCVPRIHK